MRYDLLSADICVAESLPSFGLAFQKATRLVRSYARMRSPQPVEIVIVPACGQSGPALSAVVRAGQLAQLSAVEADPCER